MSKVLPALTTWASGGEEDGSSGAGNRGVVATDVEDRAEVIRAGKHARDRVFEREGRLVHDEEAEDRCAAWRRRSEHADREQARAGSVVGDGAGERAVVGSGVGTDVHAVAAAAERECEREKG
ncbi:MAG: hypothetical protein R3B99_09765 [Polyangiales bacterium]